MIFARKDFNKVVEIIINFTITNKAENIICSNFSNYQT